MSPSSIIPVLQLRQGPPQSRARLSHKIENSWHHVTYQQLVEQSWQLSAHLLIQGISAGSRIAILSEASPYATTAFLAAINAGCTAVTLDPRWRYTHLAEAVAATAPQLIFVSRQYLARIQILQGQGFIFEMGVIVLDQTNSSNHPSITDIGDTSRQLPVTRQESTPAMIAFTAGATGKSKAVALSCSNLSFQAKSIADTLRLSETDVLLSTVPASNLLELTVTLAALNAGSRICYLPTSSPHEILQAIKQQSITLLNTSDSLLRFLRLSILKEIENLPLEQHHRFERALQLSAYLPWFALKKTLLRDLHKHLGGKIRGLICGGTTPDLETCSFYERLGIPVHTTYGLTEAGPVISLNAANNYRSATLGTCLKGVELVVNQPKSELVTRGPHVMMGYWQDHKVSSGHLDSNGWLHTGDLGSVDKQGFVRTSGRLSNTAHLAAGLTVQPELLELTLRKATGLAEVCVIALSDQELYAVAAPSTQLRFILDNNIEKLTVQIRQEFAKLMEELPDNQHPLELLICLDPLPKTADGKIRRQEVLSWAKSHHRNHKTT